MYGSSSPTVTLWFDPSHHPRAGPQSSTSCIRCSRCVRRLVMSRLRQSPASPSGPVPHACFLWVSVPLTSRAVIWRLTIRRVLDHHERQSEDVNSHPFTVASKRQYLCARTGAQLHWRVTDSADLLAGF